MPIIYLRDGYEVLVDPEDYDWLAGQYNWYLHDGRTGRLYARGRLKNSSDRPILMHRLILGTYPDQQIDHVNGDGLDNRKVNLRLATNQQNLANSAIKEHRKYKGVFLDKHSPKKYLARIGYNYKQLNLGSYPTQEEAALAYDVAARELFGEYAKTNFGDAR